MCAYSASVAISTATRAGATDAERPESVRLTLPACDELPFDSRQLVELVQLELQAIDVRGFETSSEGPSPTAGSASAASVVVAVRECGAVAEDIQLGLFENRSGRHTERTMHIADLPSELRARAIAIRIVELLRGAWPDLAHGPAERPAVEARAYATAPVRPTSSETPTAAATRAVRAEPNGETATERSPLAFEGAVSGEVFPSRNTGVLGPRATAVLDFRDARCSAAVEALFGQAPAGGAGSANVGFVSGRVGFGLHTENAILEPRMAFGHAWASGTSSNASVLGSTGGGFVAIAALAGGLRAPLPGKFAIAVDVEAGHTLAGVSFLADGERVAGISGVMLSASVGIAFRP